MERHQHEAAKSRELGRNPGLRQQANERVNHHVAHTMNLLRRDAFAAQIFVGVGRRREQQIRELVGYEAVDLLRHSSIPRAQAGLEVRDWDAKLGTDQSRSHRRVHIAIDHDPVGVPLEHDRFETQHHLRRLLRLTARPDGEVHIRFRHLQLAEKHVRHARVIVLTSMYQGLAKQRLAKRSLANIGTLPKSPKNRGRLHEIWAGAYNVKDMHGEGAYGLQPTILPTRWFN